MSPKPALTSRVTRRFRVVPINTRSTTITVGSSQTTPEYTALTTSQLNVRKLLTSSMSNTNRKR